MLKNESEFTVKKRNICIITPVFRSDKLYLQRYGFFDGRFYNTE